MNEQEFKTGIELIAEELEELHTLVRNETKNCHFDSDYEILYRVKAKLEAEIDRLQREGS